jgi:hypothetical protein
MSISEASAEIIGGGQDRRDVVVTFNTGEEFSFPCEKREDGNWYVTYADRRDEDFQPYFTKALNAILRAFEGEQVLLADEWANDYRKK